MLKDLLKELVTIISGKPSENIVDLLMEKKHVNEFIIAKKMDLTINQVRNILYKLSDEGIVSSIRKKDKRKGWYIYFWRIETLKALEALKKITEKKIEHTKSHIGSREDKVYYVCEKCNLEFNEENALLQNFTCPECGTVFTIKDNTKLIKELKKNLEKHQKELQVIEEEIAKENKNKKPIKVEAAKTKKKIVKLKKKKKVVKAKKVKLKKKK